MREEVAGEPLHQGFVGGGIGGAKVVLGVDQATAEKVPPDSVHHRPSEIGILGFRQPIGKRLAAVSRSGDRQGGVVERLGRHQLAGARVVRFPFGRRKHHNVAGSAAILQLDSGEEARHAIVLVLGPLLQRMIVATGAGQRHPEERHARTLGDVDRVAMEREIVGGSVAQGRPFRGDDRPRKLIPRLIVGNALSHKAIKRPHRGGRELVRRDEEEVRPPVGPVVDELRASKEPVDELDTLGGVFVFQKRSDLIRTRECSGGVERRAAEERRVVGGSRRRDRQRFELGEILVVDRIESRGVAEDLGVDGRFVRGSHRRPRHLAGIPDGHRSFAMPFDFDHTLVVNLGDGFVGAGVFHPAGYVLDSAVGEHSLNQKRLNRASLEPNRLGIDAQAGDFRIALRRGGGPRGDPFGHNPILKRIGSEPHTATVFDRGGCLQEDQAFGGGRGNDPPSQGLAGQNQVINLGCISSQAESKAVLAGGRAVAGSLVASGLGQNRLDMVAETPGFNPLEVLHRNGGGDGDVANLRRNRSGTVGDGGHLAVESNPRDVGPTALEDRLAGQVRHPCSAIEGTDEERLARLRSIKPSGGGKDSDLLRDGEAGEAGENAKDEEPGKGAEHG